MEATYGEKLLAVSPELLAIDSALESFANLSAGVPQLFAAGNRFSRDPIQHENPVTVFLPIQRTAWHTPDSHSLDYETRPIAFSRGPTSDDDPYADIGYVATLDEVFAVL